MPGEEGYPAYLPEGLAEFYERSGAGRVPRTASTGHDADRRGLPAGRRHLEPVSQGTLRVAKTFWALDASLAGSRHFPAINWLKSYSLYLEPWSMVHGERRRTFMANRKETMKILQREAELKDIVQLVGADALPDTERVVLEIGR